MTHAPQDASYRLASDPSGSGNLLDGRSSGRQSLHLFVDGRARERAFPLQPFGPRQSGGIDDNASITMAPSLGEIVNADHAWSVAGVGRQSPGSPANAT